MKYIDTHAHYLSYKFNYDRDKRISNLLDSDLKYIIECGTNTHFNEDVLRIVHQYDGMYGTIGYFPVDTVELEKHPKLLNKLTEQLKDDKIVGLGEIGLDNHHPGNREVQKKWFKAQLDLARNMNMPVCIHSREAEEETLEILENFGKTHGVFHCYSYGPETMKKLVDLGFYFGVGGTSTYEANIGLRKAIEEMPMDRIVLETDAPYLTPEPVRQQRNDSGFIKIVIDEISKLKGIDFDEVIRITHENAMKLYPKLGKANS